MNSKGPTGTMLPPTLRIVSLLWLTSAVAAAISLSKPNCPDKCGNVTIPYPFGVGSDCSANSWFAVTCQNSTTTPRPFLSSINLEALEFSLNDGIVRVMQPVSFLNCSRKNAGKFLGESLAGSPYTLSIRYNRLAVIGCQNIVWLFFNGSNYGGCMPTCGYGGNSTYISKLSCNGINCCQTTIPPRLQRQQIVYRSVEAGDQIGSCGYAFMVDQRWFNGDYTKYKFHDDLLNPFDESFKYTPVVLDWEFDISRLIAHPWVYCKERPSDFCSPLLEQKEHTPLTSLCFCKSGFHGNPYLPEVGCQDIDECSNSTILKHCPNGTCFNTLGSFGCFHRDDNRSGPIIALYSIGSGLGSLFFLIGVWRSSKVNRKRSEAKRKREFFKRNGGLLLEQQLSSTDNALEKTKLFGSKELAKATDQYSENRVLGRGGQGTVYKGVLADGTIVAVKRPKKVDEVDLRVFINEIVILSQINHRNVVKLLGCCLETEVPLLVYEFIPNGTLFQHMHSQNEEFPLSWQMRLRIATEVAGALSYLHSAASVPIYHRDIKSTNILLDEKYRAKVSDFGISRSIAIDQTHLTTRVLGTFGYFDPQYFQSSQFTEKSDVYSFGVVMVELLTSEKPVSTVQSEEVRGLAAYFLESMEQNKLYDVVDARVLKDGIREEIVAVAELARRCLQLDGKKRPTMMEVAVELAGIQMLKEGSAAAASDLHHSIELAEAGEFSSSSRSNSSDTISSTTHHAFTHY